MEIEKIPVQKETCLVEIVSDENASNHCVYFLDINGELIDHFKINEATVPEIVGLINHMFVIQFTTKQAFDMKCITTFNNIFEPNYIRYDDTFAWQMDSEMITIIRHFGKIKNVLNYPETEEYRSEAHIIDDFILARPTPIEQRSEEVHNRGVVARSAMLKIIQDWVL